MWRGNSFLLAGAAQQKLAVQRALACGALPCTSKVRIPPGGQTASSTHPVFVFARAQLCHFRIRDFYIRLLAPFPDPYLWPDCNATSQGTGCVPELARS